MGLTGGLACGKSTVLAVLAECGAGTIDADLIVRRLLAAGSPLLVELRTRLGDHVIGPDGSADRARIAAIVFADPERRRALEALLHPAVIRREEEETSRLSAEEGREIVVVDAALLVEAGQTGRFHRLVVASCSPSTQRRRAIARGMEPGDADRRIAAQMPSADKARLADYVIDTEGTLAQTRERARELWRPLGEDLAALREGKPLAPRRYIAGPDGPGGWR